FSNVGAKLRHGPHQGAQKSISTMPPASTVWRKFWAVMVTALDMGQLLGLSGEDPTVIPTPPRRWSQSVALASRRCHDRPVGLIRKAQMTRCVRASHRANLLGVCRETI